MSLGPPVIAKPGAAESGLERTHPGSEPGPEEGAASLRSPGPAPPRAPPEKQMLREEEICSRPSLLLIDRNIQCRDALVLQRTPGGEHVIIFESIGSVGIAWRELVPMHSACPPGMARVTGSPFSGLLR